MITPKQCEQCGKEFYGTERAKFCSDTCRLKTWRKHKTKSETKK